MIRIVFVNLLVLSSAYFLITDGILRARYWIYNNARRLFEVIQKRNTIMDELLKQTIMKELLEKIKAVQHNVTYRSFLIAINDQTN